MARLSCLCSFHNCLFSVPISFFSETDKDVDSMLGRLAATREELSGAWPIGTIIQMPVFMFWIILLDFY